MQFTGGDILVATATVIAGFGSVVLGVVLSQTKKKVDVNEYNIAKLYRECRAERSELLHLFDLMVHGTAEELTAQVSKMKAAMAVMRNNDDDNIANFN